MGVGMWRRVLVCGLFLAGAARAAETPNRIEIVTSEPAFAVGAALAHAFAQAKPFAEPSAEASSGALDAFCSGVGTHSPDIAISEHALTDGESKACRAAGVTPIEVNLGYFGLAILRKPGAPSMPLTSRMLFLAVAKDIPAGPGQELVANAAGAWNEVDPKLPKLPITIFGPPAGSIGAQSIGPLLVAQGARTFTSLKALEQRDPDGFKTFADGVRSDRAYQARRHSEAPETLLEANPGALVITDLTSISTGAKDVWVAAINGVMPASTTLANGSYPYAQPVRFYLKREHLGITPGLREFLSEALSSAALGEHGYLRPLGLVPRPNGSPGADSILARVR